jgi:hypothetical protein
MSDRLVGEVTTYIAHNKHKRRTSMTSAGFEPAIAGIELLQTYSLDHVATGIGSSGPLPDVIKLR